MFSKIALSNLNLLMHTGPTKMSKKFLNIILLYLVILFVIGRRVVLGTIFSLDYGVGKLQSRILTLAPENAGTGDKVSCGPDNSVLAPVMVNHERN